MTIHYSSKTQQKLDKQLMRVAERSDILRFLDPINKFEELDIYLAKKGDYNPQFKYSDNHIPILKEVIQYVDKLKGKIIKLRNKDNLQKLMIDKCDELQCKFKLLEAYHRQDLWEIARLNKELFGSIVDIAHFKSDFDALEKAFHIDYHSLLKPLKLHQKEQLTKNEVKDLVTYHLHKQGIASYHINFGKYWNTNMQVRIGPKPVIYINRKQSYKAIDVCISILHEIYGHLTRYYNGCNSHIHLLQGGTAYYLTHEEGIAVFLAAQVEWFEIVWKRFTSSYQQLIQASKTDRIGMTKYYQKQGRKNLEYIFWSILRLKRGLCDTSIIWPAWVFYKDKVYADGYFQIVNYLQQSSKPVTTLKKLFIWRVKLDDLQVLS